MASEKKPGIVWNDVKEATDPFNGVVAMYENKALAEEDQNRFWVEHQRKDIYTDYLTRDEANDKFEEFVNDAMF